MKTFYDLDYIIEINEKRIEELSLNYQKVLERITNILLIYSAVAIFLIPLIQELCWKEITHWLFVCSFFIFSLLFILSLKFTIRLLIPVEVYYLQSPNIYYSEYRALYEESIEDQQTIARLLKVSYISELEETLDYNLNMFRRKSSFYYNALLYALLSTIPYLVCMGFHISKKQEQIHKVERL